MIKKSSLLYCFLITFISSVTFADEPKSVGKYRNNKKPKGSRLQLFGDMFPRYVGKLPLLAVEEYFKVAKKKILLNLPK